MSITTNDWQQDASKFKEGQHEIHSRHPLTYPKKTNKQGLDRWSVVKSSTVLLGNSVNSRHSCRGSLLPVTLASGDSIPTQTNVHTPHTLLKMKINLKKINKGI